MSEQRAAQTNGADNAAKGGDSHLFTSADERTRKGLIPEDNFELQRMWEGILQRYQLVKMLDKSCVLWRYTCSSRERI